MCMIHSLEYILTDIFPSKIQFDIWFVYHLFFLFQHPAICLSVGRSYSLFSSYLKANRQRSNFFEHSARSLVDQSHSIAFWRKTSRHSWNLALKAGPEPMMIRLNEHSLSSILPELLRAICWRCLLPLRCWSGLSLGKKKCLYMKSLWLIPGGFRAFYFGTSSWLDETLLSLLGESSPTLRSSLR